MLKDAPAALIDIPLEAINLALVNNVPLPDLFKGGDICLLFKKGIPELHAIWRPIVLLTTIYKLSTSIITYRLAQFVEEHHMLDDNQEGFRRHRSTLRQAQSLA